MRKVLKPLTCLFSTNKLWLLLYDLLSASGTKYNQRKSFSNPLIEIALFSKLANQLSVVIDARF